MEQDPVHQLVLRALRGSEVVVANPATIPKAIEKGQPITLTLTLSDEAAINQAVRTMQGASTCACLQVAPLPYPGYADPLSVRSD